jgi:hypothetical protein
VAVGILGPVVERDVIPSAPVVLEPVVVVVDAVGLAAGAALAGVAGQLRREVGVGHGGARVDDGDGHTGTARDAPRRRRVDVGVRDALESQDRLAGVLQAPEVAEPRVAGERRTRADGLGPLDGGVRAQLVERARPVAVGGDDDVDAGQSQDAAGRPDVRAVAHLGPLARRELDDQRARGRVVRARRLGSGGARKDRDEQGGGLHASRVHRQQRAGSVARRQRPDLRIAS